MHQTTSVSHSFYHSEQCICAIEYDVAVCLYIGACVCVCVFLRDKGCSVLRRSVLVSLLSVVFEDGLFMPFSRYSFSCMF